MAGHSKWAQIKHQKGAADQKRGALFSKLLNAIAAAARIEPNPDFNPRLRTAIQTAKDNNVPQENIARALTRASSANEALEDLVFELYGPGGVAIVVSAISMNRNRTVAEIKKIAGDYGGKWAESGSVQWAFERHPDGTWSPKFTPPLTSENIADLATLMQHLENHPDVQRVYTNAPATP